MTDHVDEGMIYRQLDALLAADRPDRSRYDEICALVDSTSCSDRLLRSVARTGVLLGFVEVEFED